MKNYRLMVLTIVIVNCLYTTGQTYNEVEKFYNKIAATHEVEKKIEGCNFYRITNLEAVEILGGCYNWGSSGNGSLAIVVGENETNVVLDFAQDLFPNPPYSNITGSVTERAYFSHDGVWSVGKVDNKIIFRCFKCSVHIYMIDYKNTKWVGNHWTSPDKPTQFWFAVTTRNLYGFRMGQMEWEPMTKENVRLGEKRSSNEVISRLESERKAERERQAKVEAERRAEEERKVKLEAERKAKEEAERKAKVEAERKAKAEAERREREELHIYTKGSIAAKAYENDKTNKKIIIHEGVTEIGDNAFHGCEYVPSVTLPKSVKKIGRGAFHGCKRLTSINLPNGIMSINSYTFCYCEGLTSVSIPNSVTIIGEFAFFNCTSLMSVTIPNNVTEIGDDAFWRCESLTSITIPNSVEKIGKSAFEGCPNLSITLPKRFKNKVKTKGCKNVIYY